MELDYRSDALAHLGAVQASVAGLRDLYADATATYDAPDKRRVAAFYDDIRQGIKLAEVYALLSIGERLDALVQRLEG